MREHPSEGDQRAAAIYHVVHAHESFEHAANALFQLVTRSQEVQPGKTRLLYLDIEGHRNNAGGFDADMLELQEHFVAGFLSQFVSAIHCPLIQATNPNGQSDDIPMELIIQDKQS